MSDLYRYGGTGLAARCVHGYTRLQGCRACGPTEWRDEYAARVYRDTDPAPEAPARDLSSPSPDPDPNDNETKGL